MFGSAIDDAIGLICLLKHVNPSEKQKKKIEKLKKDPEYPYRLFDNRFAIQKSFETLANSPDDNLDIRKDHRCVYSDKDFDPDILEEVDHKLLRKYIKTAGYELTDVVELWQAIADEIKEKKRTSLINQEYYNYCCFLSLRRKARILLDIFRDEVLPQIDEIHSIQEYVKLDNGEGDTLIGYIDLVGKLKGEDFLRVIDIKTSSAKYKKNSVQESQQLAIYTEYKDMDKAAYIVLVKNPEVKDVMVCNSCDNDEEYLGKRRKKCPECGAELEFDYQDKNYIYQIVKGEVTEEFKDEIFEEISDVMADMNEKEFPVNWDSCFQFGKKCPYYQFCRDGNMEGLTGFSYNIPTKKE